MERDLYKFDNRTREEFLSDMRKGLNAEAVSIRILRMMLENSDVENPEIVYVGTSKEASVVFDSNNRVADIDVFPDYLLKYKRIRRIRFNFIEVKVCNPHSKECFFKVKQLNQYRELEKVLILFVMGFNTDNPKFILVEPEKILNLNIEPVDVYGKKTIKVPVSYFNWEEFSPDRTDIGDILTKEYLQHT